MKKTDVRLIHGECLAEMAKLPDGCVDMVMCDLPYGTTACKWDAVIDLTEMWKQYKRVCKEGGGYCVNSITAVYHSVNHVEPQRF